MLMTSNEFKPKNVLKNNLYNCEKNPKKPNLMMAYERFKCTWDNFGKLIYQLQPKTKTLVKKFERIQIKLYRQINMLK